MSGPTVGIDITANDRTARGARSAERTVGASVDRTARRASDTTRRVTDDTTRSVGRSTRGITRAFTEVERGAARVFGNRSILSGVSGRLGGITEAAAGLGSGLGDAAAAGGVLSGTLGVVGVAAAGTIGVLAAAAYGAFKLADGWAKGAASIGRTAETIGVTTKALQEFTAAAERAGVDKDKAAGSLGSLSQTLNDARYGRNNAALAMLTRLGVKMQTNADGTVNVEAMLPAIADAIQRQNSSGRRTAAKNLGIDLAALPAFTQGGKALSADMRDAETTAPLITDADVTVGKRLQRHHVIVQQRAERETIGRAGRYAAEGLDGAESFAISQFSGAVRDDFKPSARLNRDAAEKMDRAAGRIELATIGARAAGRLSAGQVHRLARRAAPIKEEAKRYGFSDAEAAGIAANVVLESGGDHHARERGGSRAGRGLIQWTDPARKALFRRVTGVDVENATRDQQWRFLRWETQNSESAGWRKALAHGQDPAAIAAGFARHVERPADKDRDSAERAAVAEAIPVHVTVEVPHAPSGTRATVRAGKGNKPAISHAHHL